MILEIICITGFYNSAIFSYTYSGYRWQLNCAEINIFGTLLEPNYQCAANSARQTWNQSGSNFTFILNDYCNNYIGWDILPSYIIALTVTTLNNNGYIENCYTLLNIYVSFSRSGELNTYDVESVFFT